MLLVCLTSGFDLGFLLLMEGHSPTRTAQGYTSLTYSCIWHVSHNIVLGLLLSLCRPESVSQHSHYIKFLEQNRTELPSSRWLGVKTCQGHGYMLTFKQIVWAIDLHCKQTIQKFQFIGSFAPHSVPSLGIGHHCVQHVKHQIKKD